MTELQKQALEKLNRKEKEREVNRKIEIEQKFEEAFTQLSKDLSVEKIDGEFDKLKFDGEEYHIVRFYGDKYFNLTKDFLSGYPFRDMEGYGMLVKDMLRRKGLEDFRNIITKQ